MANKKPINPATNKPYDPNTNPPTNPAQIKFQQDQARAVANNTVRINGQLPQSSPAMKQAVQQHNQAAQTAALQTGDKLVLNPDNTGALQTQQQNQADQVRAQLAQQAQQDQIKQHMQAQQPVQFPEQPFVQPNPLQPDISTNTFSALNVGKTISGAAAGATTGAGIGAAIGSVVPGIGTAIGAAVLGTAGAIGGGGTAFFYSQAQEKKQVTRTAYAQFTTATKEAQFILNRANAKLDSQQNLRADWDNQHLRVLQSQRELKALNKNLFGAELAHNSDELVKVNAWLDRFDRYTDTEFQMALTNPDPTKIDTGVAVPDQVDTTQ